MTPTQFRAGGSGNVDSLRGRRMLARSDPGRRDRQGRLRDRPRRRSGWAGARSAGSFPERASWSAATRPSSSSWPRWSASSMRPRKVSTSRSTFAAPLSSSGYGDASATSRRARPQAMPRSPAHRRAEGRARGGAGVRSERACGGHSVSSGRAHGRPALGLPLGRCSASGLCWRGRREHDPRTDRRTRACTYAAARSLAIPIEAIDWARIAADLDAHGCATTGRLLSAQQCAELAETYATDAPFRSRVVMARHGFGRGEYKYFAYPLPEPVAVLRAALYPPLAEIANRWNEAMAIDRALSARARELISRAATRRDRPSRRRCCCSTAPATTIACTRISTASTCFRCRSRCCCREPGEDFTGGEFVLTEQRPRMQSRAEVVPLAQGEAVIFPVHHRPVQGTRGIYRVNMRHGVSRLRSGHRHTLGIIFHDAK